MNIFVRIFAIYLKACEQLLFTAKLGISQAKLGISGIDSRFLLKRSTWSKTDRGNHEKKVFSTECLQYYSLLLCYPYAYLLHIKYHTIP